jgi:hypothetical protein
MNFKGYIIINSLILLIISIKLIFEKKMNNEGWRRDNGIYFIGLITYLVFL